MVPLADDDFLSLKRIYSVLRWKGSGLGERERKSFYINCVRRGSKRQRQAACQYCVDRRGLIGLKMRSDGFLSTLWVEG